jgi:hypothetical protein
LNREARWPSSRIPAIWKICTRAATLLGAGLLLSPSEWDRHTPGPSRGRVGLKPGETGANDSRRAALWGVCNWKGPGPFRHLRDFRHFLALHRRPKTGRHLSTAAYPAPILPGTCRAGLDPRLERFAQLFIERLEAGVNCIFGRLGAIPEKMADPEILDRASPWLQAVHLLSHMVSSRISPGPSSAGMGLQIGGLAAPDSERPELWVVPNPEAGSAIFSPRIFQSRNQKGPPHFKASQQVHRLCATHAQAPHLVSPAQLSWFPGFGRFPIIRRPTRTGLMSAAGPPLFAPGAIFPGGTPSMAICGPLSSCLPLNLPCKLPGYVALGSLCSLFLIHMLLRP